MKTPTLIAIGLLGFSLHASAQVTSLPDFDTADADGDQLLSIEEAQQAFGKAFPGIEFKDRDENGYLTKREAEEAIPGLVYEHADHEASVNVARDDYLEILETIENELQRRQRVEQQPEVELEAGDGDEAN